MRLLILFSVISFGLSAQVGTGQWRMHIPSHQAIDVVANDGHIYTAFENGLSEYGISTSELSIWDAVNALSDISLSCLGHSTANNSVFVGYENGNLDKIKNHQITNIPAIRLAQVQGSKRINKLVEHDGYIFAATGFAIVKIDPVKNEVKDTYYPTNGNEAILDVAFLNDSIYAITDDRMYRGLTNNIALADPTQWDVDARVPILTVNNYQEIEAVNDTLYLLLKVDDFGNDTVYSVRPTSISPAITNFIFEIYSINKVREKLAVNYTGGTILYNSDHSVYESIGAYSFGGNANLHSLTYADDSYWFADDQVGLVKYTSPYVDSRITFPGPPENSYYAMDWDGDKLVVCSGGLAGTARTYNKGGVYIFEDEDWTQKYPGNMNLWADTTTWDFLSVAINPTDKNQVAVGTYSSLPVSILNIDGQVTDTFSPNNTPLEWTSLGNGSSMVSEVEYDDQGNLWMLNAYSVMPLKVYTKDNLWYEYDLGAAAKGKFTDNMVIDYNGNKWLSINGVGMYGYNDNETISNDSDDKYVLLNMGENTGALPSNQINTMAVDFDNEIWIGTDNGFAVLYNSDASFDAALGDYNAQRIKVEFEGNVEYVLGTTYITDIEVDGANRKWFGTSSAGIILLSADGLEIIEQHTVENSPLISNNILDLRLDHSTGELFIITDQGMISYRTDATYEDPDYEDVVVFPNPARPDFSGPITIQGIRYNSDVRITDVAGNLVYQTTSNGGTATWDCNTLTGERVQTGVYLIWTAPNEGKGRFVGKVVVVN